MKFLLTMGAAAAFATIATAQCRSCGTVYQSQVYAPQFQQAYYPGYQIVQPVAVQAFLVPNSYYSVDPDLAAVRIQQQVADEAAERALAKFYQFLQQQQMQNPQPGIPPAARLPGNEHPSSLATKVQAVMDAQCVKCHKPGGSMAALDLRDVGKLTEVQALKIVARTTLNEKDKGFMPQGGHFIGDQAYDDVAHWAYEVSSRSKPPTGPAPKAEPPAPPTKAVDPVPPAPPVPPSPPAKQAPKAGGKADEKNKKDKDPDDEGLTALRRRTRPLVN